MKNLFTYTVIIIALCLFINPIKTNACDLSSIRSEYTSRGLSGSGMENQAISDCLNEQRKLDQRVRDQSRADAEYFQGLYEIKLTHFYKLDKIEKQIDEEVGNDFNYAKYRFLSTDCSKSIRIPSDPTILDPSIFLELIENKEKCIDHLLKYIKPKVIDPIKQPTKTNDQICKEKFGQNWKWNGTKNSEGGLTCDCKDGYAQKNGKCITYDQSCNISYQNTVFSKISDAGTRICDCKSGYEWNEQETGCVIKPVVPVKTNDQICKEKFGQNRKWDGSFCACKDGYTQNNGACVTYDQSCSLTYSNTEFSKIDNNGTPSCACKSGYEWNEQKTGCTIKPVVPVKTNDQICQDDYGLNSIWDGIYNNNNGLVCGCKSGYQWNKQRNSCVVVPVVPAKTNDEICKEIDPNSYFAESFYEGELVCSCNSGYIKNSSNEKCFLETNIQDKEKQTKQEKNKKITEKETEIKNKKENKENKENIASVDVIEVATSTEKQEIKGFWSKIKSWLIFW